MSLQNSFNFKPLTEEEIKKLNKKELIEYIITMKKLSQSLEQERQVDAVKNKTITINLDK